MPVNSVRAVKSDSLKEFSVTVMVRCGMREDDARTSAQVLVMNDSWGIFTHGTKQLLSLLIMNILTGAAETSRIPILIYNAHVFCRDMPAEQFYERYIPSVLSDFFGSADIDREESGIPEYIPFLQGSRYSMEQLKAGFSGLTLETTRDKVLLAVIKGNAVYHGKHLKEMAAMVNLSRKVMVTGGGAKIPGFIEVKKRWTGDFEYEFQEQSSLLGQLYWDSFTRQAGIVITNNGYEGVDD